MRLIGVILLLFYSLHAHGRTIKDTIYTTDGDRIILTYEILNAGNQTTIRFLGQQKKLGRLNAQYKELSKVAVMFFDRVGNYRSDVSIINMVPEALMIPSDVQFQKSQDGFYLVQAEPKLSFTVTKDTEVTIPIYLAYKAKRAKYILFSKSMDLKIPLKMQEEPGVSLTTAQQTITSTIEVEPDNTVTIKILESINIAKSLIAETTELPFSENLLDEINYLRQKRREITDDVLVSEIIKVMNQYESKKQLLEEKNFAEQQAHQQEEELKALKEAQTIRAQNDSIAISQQMAAEEENQRNRWMVVGGVVLAVLAFVGNQIFQSIRNKNNQLRMIAMQQDIANKAEAEAKRQARNALRSQKNKMGNEIKQKASNTIRKKATIDVNGKSKKALI